MNKHQSIRTKRFISTERRRFAYRPWTVGLAMIVFALVATLLTPGMVSAQNGAPTVDGRFSNDEDNYILLGQQFIDDDTSGQVRGSLYAKQMGTKFYGAVVLDPHANDNTFSAGPPDYGSAEADYMAQAGWDNHRSFRRLTDSEYMEFSLTCGAHSWTWKQSVLQDSDLDPTDANANWTSHVASGNAPPHWEGATSTQWNLLNSNWDVTDGGTLLDADNYISPYIAPAYTLPDSHASAPYFDENFQWEWRLVYEFSIDLDGYCDPDQTNMEVTGAHNSPAKNGSEDVIIKPGAAVGDTVWYDINADGIQDPNEPGIPNVTLKLWAGSCPADPSSGTPVQTTTTNGNGLYSFLIPAKNVSHAGTTYCVTVDESTVPAKYFKTFNYSPTDITLKPGDIFLGADFGYSERGKVKINKTNDQNAPLSGVEMCIYYAPTNGGTVLPNKDLADECIFTNDAGSASFGGLHPGTYLVCEVLPDGWINVVPGDAGLQYESELGDTLICESVDVSAGKDAPVVDFVNKTPNGDGLDISKTAHTKWAKETTWEIEKTVDQNVFNLFLGEEASFNYTVAVTPTASNIYTVTGEITVKNKTGKKAYIKSITDVIQNYSGPLTISCADGAFTSTDGSITFEPAYALHSDATLTCTYTATGSGTSNPFGESTVNTVTVVTKDDSAQGGQANADVNFAAEPDININASVTVTDTNLPGESRDFTEAGTWTYALSQLCHEQLDYVDGVATVVIDNTARIIQTGQEDNQTVTVICDAAPPAFKVDKSATPLSRVQPGGLFTFTVVLTNNGDNDLTLTSLTDNPYGDLLDAQNSQVQNNTCLDLIGTNIPANGGQVSCSFQVDIQGEPGDYLDTVTAVGEDEFQQEVSDSDDATVTITPVTPPGDLDIEIEKATNGVDADDPTGPFILAGEQVTWTYVITNHSDVTIFNVVVTDDNGTPGNPDDDFSPCSFDELASGASETCQWSGVAQAGQYGNMAVVSGSREGTEVSDSDPSHYFGAAPAIDILKLTNDVDAKTPATAVQLTVGDAVTWSYIVTNTGNVPLSNVTVSDDQGVEVTCPQNTLGVAPDNTMTCTGTGTAVEGAYANIGTADGQYNDTPVQASDPSHYVAQPTTEPLGAIGDFVWLDENENGRQDEGEPGIPGVTVHLYEAGGETPIATTTTNQSGGYLFEGLPAGDYVVEFVLPEGYEFTTQHAESVPADLDSDAAPTTGRTPTISLAPGQIDTTWDAGLVEEEAPGTELASLGDFVWLDEDRDGIQDPNEPGVEGVEVQLFQVIDGEGTFTGQTQTTDANGFYLFSQLAPGDYYVEFVLPEGYSFTLPNQGDDDTINSKATVPELTLTVNSQSDSVFPGGVMTYTVEYTHQGGRPADGVSLSIVVPEQTSFDPARNPGWVCPNGGIQGNTCNLTIGTVQPGSSDSISLYLDVNQNIENLPIDVSLVVELWQTTDGVSFVTTLGEGDSDLRHDAGIIPREPTTGTEEPVTVVFPPTDLPGEQQPNVPRQNLPSLFMPIMDSAN